MFIVMFLFPNLHECFKHWNGSWQLSSSQELHEATVLRLDTDKARSRLFGSPNGIFQLQLAVL